METTVSYRESVVPMTDNERDTLRKRLRLFVGIGLIIELFALGMALVFSRDFSTDNWTDYLFTGLIGFFMLAVAGVIAYATRLVMRDLQSGTKKIISGMVNGKREEIYRRSGSSSGSNTDYYYYLNIGGKDFKVESNAYHAIKTGDAVHVHFSMYSETMLAYEIVSADTFTDRTANPSVLEQASREVFRELPLSAGEKSILWRMLLQRLLIGMIGLFLGGIVVLLLGLLLMIALSQLIGGSLGSVTILSWLAILYLTASAALALFLLYRYIKNPIRDLVGGQKLYTIAVISDKQVIQSLNRREHTFYELHMNGQSFRVAQHVHDGVTIGEKLMIAQAPHSKIIFSITLADGTVL